MSEDKPSPQPTPAPAPEPGPAPAPDASPFEKPTLDIAERGKDSPEIERRGDGR
jgi:hypothetical protein